MAIKYIEKTTKGPQTQIKTNRKLAGVPRKRGVEFKRVPKTGRSVSRPYGAKIDGIELKDRILRAFIVEEVKEVKRTVRLMKKEAAQQQASKGKKSKKSKKSRK